MGDDGLGDDGAGYEGGCAGGCAGPVVQPVPPAPSPADASSAPIDIGGEPGDGADGIPGDPGDSGLGFSPGILTWPPLVSPIDVCQYFPSLCAIGGVIIAEAPAVIAPVLVGVAIGISIDTQPTTTPGSNTLGGPALKRGRNETGKSNYVVDRIKNTFPRARKLGEDPNGGVCLQLAAEYAAASTSAERAAIKLAQKYFGCRQSNAQ